jgi:drug/metabolite transporter (DMT)-like permease
MRAALPALGGLGRWWVSVSAERRILKVGQVYALLAVTILILGVNWPLNTIALRSVSPLWFTVFRVGGATVVMGVLNLARGQLRVPPRHDWSVILAVGLFRVAGVFALVFLALKFVPPGRSSVLVYTASVWAVPIATVFLHERMSALRWIGLVVGIGGIVLLFEPWQFVWSDGQTLLGHGFLLLAAILLASTAVYIRGHRWQVSPLNALPWQLLLAVGALLGTALVVEGRPVVHWSWPFVANLSFQSVLVSGFALWATQTVLRRLGATSTTLLMMAVPVVGLVSSVLILQETISAVGLLGVAAILGGVAASAAADARTAEAAPPV